MISNINNKLNSKLNNEKLKSNISDINNLSSDFVISFKDILVNMKDRLYHRDDSYLYEIFVGLSGNSGFGKNFLLSYNEKNNNIVCSEFEVSQIPIFGSSKLRKVFEFGLSGVKELEGFENMSEKQKIIITNNFKKVIQSVVGGINDIDRDLYRPPKTETIKKFIMLKFDEIVKDFIGVKTKMGKNEYNIDEQYSLIKDWELKTINDDLKNIKDKVSFELSQKYPNFMVAYSYIDDMKNLTSRKKFIIDHNKTILSIVSDRQLEFFMIGDIMPKGTDSIMNYPEYIEKRSEVLTINEEEKHLNRFVNYIYEKHNKIYSKEDLKDIINSFLNNKSNF